MSRYLYEVSWEVCNKVGGIHTVLASKSAHAVSEFGENYVTVGPLLDTNGGFIDEPFEGADAMVAALATRGITARAGRWDTDAKPKSLLVSFRDVIHDHNRLLFELWENYGVDSMFGQWDYIEPVLFSTVCGMAIEALTVDLDEDAEVYAHFHEWLCGAGLLYLKKHAPHVSTVFTTHATMLGRAMSGAGNDIFSHLDDIDPATEAKRYGVTAKYSMESVSARQADCFTAVSDVTGREALALLGVNPGVITPNGFDTGTIPDLAADPKLFRKKRTRLLDFASRFLQKELDPDNTLVMSISGRYEYQNKGIDLFLDSLKDLETHLESQGGKPMDVVAFFLVLGGYVGVHEEALLRTQHTFSGLEGASVISTHHLTNRHDDPVLNACKRLGFANAPDNRVNIIFIPAYLDGKDGALNIPYYDALAGCDLGVYPSYYEPWGYTPLESVAYAVPAVTTDRAGFGQWLLDHHEGQTGAIVIRRRDSDYNDARRQLTEALVNSAGWNADTRQEWKRGARAIASQVGWDTLYEHYRTAYARAALASADRTSGMPQVGDDDARQVFIAPTNSATPRMRPLAVVSELPEELADLQKLAYSLWWIWRPEARTLFQRLDPVAWEESRGNPLAMLQRIDYSRMQEAVEDESYMQLYAKVNADYRKTVVEQSCCIDALKQVTRERPVAYFSMEFGLHECLPVYSGGLGILSGDHLKSASELSIPLVGVGILYKFGYFEQRIDRNGDQVPVYVENNFAQMPVSPVLDAQGKPARVSVEMPGRWVHAQAWVVQVGSVSLYMLDTDIDDNAEKDRYLTSKLYDSSTRERIEQEILLGIGGTRLLKSLGIAPSVYHLNEGHSAFLLVEQLRMLMVDDGLPFETAREVVRARSVFTTHTPVPAGNERFNMSLIENYFRPYIDKFGMTWEQFANLGHVYAGTASDFEMTILALKMCSRYNGVSRLHGRVARDMWHHAWRGFLPEEVPIGHITNGVHYGSWVADDIREVIRAYAGITSERALLEPDEWDKIHDIPDKALWDVHTTLKGRLIETVRQTVQHQWAREGEDPSLLEQFRVRLNPAALTIGFARRIATYKRPLLLLKDLERLRAIVKNETNPVQIIFAGKAHPADKQAAALIREIVAVSKQPDFLGRLVFLENYNIRLARALVSGVDLWLNNPVRPMEASGTSGMKAAFNGVVNCSILDGWWDECYEEDPESGWAIGDGVELGNRDVQDVNDSGRIYEILEERVIPTYYNRNARNVPVDWVSVMKHAMSAGLRRYNTHRMLKEYAEQMYEPAAAAAASLTTKKWAGAASLGDWRKRLPVRFASLSLDEVRVDGLKGNILNAQDKLRVSVTVSPGKMRPSEILLELVLHMAGEQPVAFELEHTGKRGSQLVYEGEFGAPGNGQYRYGIRAIPVHEGTVTKFDSCLASWG